MVTLDSIFESLILQEADLLDACAKTGRPRGINNVDALNHMFRVFAVRNFNPDAVA